MADELKEFYTAKLKPKKGFSYGYDDDGNLVVRNKEEVIKTITLPVYRRPTLEEIKSMKQSRDEAIALANQEVDDARMLLYEESKKQKGERDDKTMVRLNRAVVEADSRLNMVRFPLRRTDRVDGIRIKELDFTQPNEVRVLPYPVSFIETRPYTLQDQYVRVGALPEKPLISVAEAKNAMKMAEHVPVIVFEGPDTNDYGYLSLKWPAVFEFNSTTYQSAHHAIYTELAKHFDDTIHLPQLLAAKTANDVDYSVEDVPGDSEQDKETNKEEWNTKLRGLLYDVNLVKFNKYRDLGVQLLETGNAIIGAYQPDDTLIGTGIAIESPDAKDVTKWSENALGKVLMDIREILRRDLVAPVAEPVAEPMAEPIAEPMAVPNAVPMAVPVAASVAASITKMKKPKRNTSVAQASVAPVAQVEAPVAQVEAPVAQVEAPVAQVEAPVVVAPIAVPIAVPNAVPNASQPVRIPRIATRPKIVRAPVNEKIQ
jgi:ribA/ribD-fused uncharacterized protein